MNDFLGFAADYWPILLAIGTLCAAVAGVELLRRQLEWKEEA